MTGMESSLKPENLYILLGYHLSRHIIKELVFENTAWLGPFEGCQGFQKLGLTFHFGLRAENLGFEVGLGFLLGASEPRFNVSSAWKV